jgi:hypothetical protein
VAPSPGARSEEGAKTLNVGSSKRNARGLCKDLPHELEEFASYCFDLGINREPDYRFLRTKLTAIVNREGESGSDGRFEWKGPGWTRKVPYLPISTPPDGHDTKHVNCSSLGLLHRSRCIRRPQSRARSCVGKFSQRRVSTTRRPPGFPHETLVGAEWEFCRRGQGGFIDARYEFFFNLDVYPLARAQWSPGTFDATQLGFAAVRSAHLICDQDTSALRPTLRVPAFFAVAVQDRILTGKATLYLYTSDS